MTTGTTAAEWSGTKENRTRDRRATVRNLLKYRAIAAEKYRESLERLMDRRDDTAFLKDSIQRSDLVMRSPINRPSKLHPQWDGPFIILEITDKDIMQLATPNGYILNHLINKARIRKLDKAETKYFMDELWQASKRLKKYKECEKMRTGVDTLHIELSKAAIQHLNAVSKGKPVDPRIPATIVQKHNEITKLQVAKPTEKDDEAPRRSLRLRRPTTKALEAVRT